ncbi:MAG: hypothetical protein M3P40_06425 [Actinomycetota bacterium]|nr:hypothetical protein [Actinomycetota bacterium]
MDVPHGQAARKRLKELDELGTGRGIASGPETREQPALTRIAGGVAAG